MTVTSVDLNKDKETLVIEKAIDKGIDKGKKNVLGILVDAVDYTATVSKIITAAKARKSLSY
jgi:hypothetical protein